MVRSSQALLGIPGHTWLIRVTLGVSQNEGPPPSDGWFPFGFLCNLQTNPLKKKKKKNKKDVLPMQRSQVKQKPEIKTVERHVEAT